MKIKKEYFVLVALILGLSLYLIFYNSDRTNYLLPKLPEISKKEISKIEISKSGNTIVLIKDNKNWQFDPQGYPADHEKIKNMLDCIANLTLTELASESGSYDRYDLDDNKKILVKAFLGDALSREFEVGKVAPSFRHTFVKIAGDPLVYHARQNLRDKFDQTVEQLRDKTVFSFEKTGIREILVTKDKQSVKFVKKEASGGAGSVQTPAISSLPASEIKMVWQTIDGKKGDDAGLDRLIATISDLRCEKYLDNSRKEDLKNPIYTLKLKGVKEYSLSIFAKTDKDEKSNPAISSENDYPFLLPAWQGENIMVSPDELLEKSDKD